MISRLFQLIFNVYLQRLTPFELIPTVCQMEFRSMARDLFILFQVTLWLFYTVLGYLSLYEVHNSFIHSIYKT
ncbi:hypothetical protein Hanom_Chr09g00764461 [Helianthus anomalus]